MAARALMLALALLSSATAGATPGRIERVVHRRAGVDPELGPPHAPVTIEAFLNPGDGFASGQVLELLRQLAARHPRRLRVVIRLGAGGPVGSPHLHAALEAQRQGRFFELIDVLYRGTRRSPREDVLPALGAQAGLAAGPLAAALTPGSPRALELEAVVRAAHDARRRLGVRRVPGLVINGVPYERRPGSVDELEARFDEAYAEVAPLLASGVPVERLHEQLLARRRRRAEIPPFGPLSLDGFVPGEAQPEPQPRPIHLDGRVGLRFGPAGADLTIVFACNLVTRPCGQAAAALAEVRAAYPERIAVRYRPLFDEADPAQAGAARHAAAVRCAARQGRGEAMFDALRIGRGGRPGGLEEPALAELAAELGLHRERFAACLTAPTTAAAVAREVAAARRDGLLRTPSLVIDGRLHLGARSFDELHGWIERALEPGLLGG